MRKTMGDELGEATTLFLESVYDVRGRSRNTLFRDGQWEAYVSHLWKLYASDSLPTPDRSPERTRTDPCSTTGPPSAPVAIVQPRWPTVTMAPDGDRQPEASTTAASDFPPVSPRPSEDSNEGSGPEADLETAMDLSVARVNNMETGGLGDLEDIAIDLEDIVINTPLVSMTRTNSPGVTPYHQPVSPETVAAYMDSATWPPPSHQTEDDADSIISIHAQNRRADEQSNLIPPRVREGTKEEKRRWFNEQVTQIVGKARIEGATQLTLALQKLQPVIHHGPWKSHRSGSGNVADHVQHANRSGSGKVADHVQHANRSGSGKVADHVQHAKQSGSGNVADHVQHANRSGSGKVADHVQHANRSGSGKVASHVQHAKQSGSGKVADHVQHAKQSGSGKVADHVQHAKQSGSGKVADHVQHAKQSGSGKVADHVQHAKQSGSGKVADHVQHAKQSGSGNVADHHARQERRRLNAFEEDVKKLRLWPQQDQYKYCSATSVAMQLFGVTVSTLEALDLLLQQPEDEVIAQPAAWIRPTCFPATISTQLQPLNSFHNQQIVYNQDVAAIINQHEQELATVRATNRSLQEQLHAEKALRGTEVKLAVQSEIGDIRSFSTKETIDFLQKEAPTLYNLVSNLTTQHHRETKRSESVATVILSAVNPRSIQATGLQTIVELMLVARTSNDQIVFIAMVIQVLNHTGITVSPNSLRSVMKQFADQRRKEKRKAEIVWVYDNVNIMRRLRDLRATVGEGCLIPAELEYLREANPDLMSDEETDEENANTWLVRRPAWWCSKLTKTVDRCQPAFDRQVAKSRKLRHVRVMTDQPSRRCIPVDTVDKEYLNVVGDENEEQDHKLNKSDKYPY
ncbi:Hypp6575 [Branchiostoma lanceolatum]|uniref:Hypp6575 protein n=1 Tax=Branchiostoma lanceolatum TaxID=7740 RepID=A0A8J9YV73_BRALA|nr:Hypp6575 [Branchiostoma lanceolatum]